MFPVTRERLTAIVVFQGAEHRRFWRIFTGRGWRHVWAILPSYYPEPGLFSERHSVIVNLMTNHVQIGVLFQAPDDVALKAINDGALLAIKFPVDRKGAWDYVPRGFLTCVSLLKAVLGIRAWYLVTPFQLARWLLRNGGSIMGASDGCAFRQGFRRQGRAARAAPAVPPA